MENLLPKWSSELDTIEERSMPNAQWQPGRSTYKAGTMLPARLRMLVQLSQAEDAIENPQPTVVSRTAPLEEQSVGSSSQNFASPFDSSSANPSPLCVAARGQLPPSVSVRVDQVPFETPAWSPNKEGGSVSSSTRSKADLVGSTTSRAGATVPLFTVMHDAEPRAYEDPNGLPRRLARLLPEAASQVNQLPSNYGAVDRGMLALLDEGEDDEYESGYAEDGGEENGAGMPLQPNVARVVDVYVWHCKTGKMAHHELSAGSALMQPAGGGPRLPPPPEAYFPYAQPVRGSIGESGNEQRHKQPMSASASTAVTGVSVLCTTRSRLKRRSGLIEGASSAHSQSKAEASEGTPLGRDSEWFDSSVSGEGSAEIDDAWMGFDGELPEEIERRRAARALAKAQGSDDGSNLSAAGWKPRAVSFESLGGDQALGLELEYDADHNRCHVFRCIPGGQAHARGVVPNAKVFLVSALPVESLRAPHEGEEDDEADEDDDDGDGDNASGSGSTGGRDREFSPSEAVILEVQSLGDFERAIVRLRGRPFEVTFLEPGEHQRAIKGLPSSGYLDAPRAANPEADKAAKARVYAAAAALPEALSEASLTALGVATKTEEAAPDATLDPPCSETGTEEDKCSNGDEEQTFEPGQGAGNMDDVDGDEELTFVTGRGVGAVEYPVNADGDGDDSGLQAARVTRPQEALPWEQPAPVAAPVEEPPLKKEDVVAPDDATENLLKCPDDLPLALSRSEDLITASSTPLSESISASSASSHNRQSKPRNALKSGPRAVSLHFINDSPHFNLEVSWVDFDGVVQLRAVLKPGEQHYEKSWAGHPWSVTAVSPPRFDPRRHADAADADWDLPEPHDMNPSLVVRVGQVAASGSYTMQWAPRRRSLSLASRDATATRLAAEGGRNRPSKSGASATGTHGSVVTSRSTTTSAQRVRLARTSLLQELKELRMDPTGQSSGAPPTLTIKLVASRRGEYLTPALLSAAQGNGGHREQISRRRE